MMKRVLLMLRDIVTVYCIGAVLLGTTGFEWKPDIVEKVTLDTGNWHCRARIEVAMPAGIGAPPCDVWVRKGSGQ